jgi:S-adenosylmethionine hydrolase
LDEHRLGLKKASRGLIAGGGNAGAKFLILRGDIPVLDVQYGNVWTNIPQHLFDELGVKPGDKLKLEIFHDGLLVDSVVAPYADSFGFVPKGQPVVYINSLFNLSLALNQGNYAADHHIGSGTRWTVRVTRP